MRRIYRRRRLLLLVVAVAAVAALALIVSALVASGTRVSGKHVAGRAARRSPPHAAASSHGAPAREPPLASELAVNRRILSYTSYISRGSPRRHEVALTFDDGPGPYTLAVLGVLERLHARASFFEIGRQVREYPQVTERLAAAGMTIGDHTEAHPPMAQLSPRQQASELEAAAVQIQVAGAPAPLLFRPPYGSFDAATLRLLRKRDMVMVLWSLDTSDYTQPGVRQIVRSALEGADAGAIVLMHDGGGDRAQTVAALPRIVDGLRARGLRLVTVPELLRDDPPPAGQPPPVNLAGG